MTEISDEILLLFTLQDNEHLCWTSWSEVLCLSHFNRCYTEDHNAFIPLTLTVHSCFRV